MRKVLKKLEKVLKMLVVSILICSCITFALIVINSIMGIHIGLDYYLMFELVLAAGLTIGLVLLDSKRIFENKKKTKKNIAPNNKSIKSQNNKSKETRRIS